MTVIRCSLVLGTSLFCGVVATAVAGATGEPLHGAGATFPAPLYAEWSTRYAAAAATTVIYDAVGSGAGIERMRRHEVDFAGSDVPLSREELAAAQWVQFPLVIGGVVPVFNVSGIAAGRLRLDGAVLAAIYLGEIRRWDDPRLAALNPTLKLPGANITVVHRSDASGSSWLWGDYLSRSSPAWQRQVGRSLAPSWPVGTGGEGNEGVASYVQRTRFSIGYVEYAFARRHHLNDTALRNRNGLYVRAGADTFRAAADATEWDSPVMMRQLPTDLPGVDVWPITGVSFILMERRPQDTARAQVTLRFFDWALRDGEATSRKLNYVALGGEATSGMPQLWATIRGVDGRTAWP